MNVRVDRDLLPAAFARLLAALRRFVAYYDAVGTARGIQWIARHDLDEFEDPETP